MRILIVLIMVLAMPGSAWAADTAHPTLKVSGFDYATDVPGHTGFEASFGLYSCSAFNPDAKTIFCTITVENKPVEVIVRALGTWGRKSKPIGIATFTPPPGFFEDLPAPETPAELVITPIE